jgi:hypothetical protein
MFGFSFKIGSIKLIQTDCELCRVRLLIKIFNRKLVIKAIIKSNFDGGANPMVWHACCEKKLNHLRKKVVVVVYF